MSASRDEMVAELKRVVVPALRGLGFKGAFPHFRRTTATQVELLTFQFSVNGGQFVVEVGKFPPDGYQAFDRFIPAAEVKMRHLLRRLRLGAKGESGDHWFNFDRGNYAKVAESVLPYLHGQAAKWWAKG